MGEIIKPGGAGTTITNTISPTVTITSVSGIYSLFVNQGPYFNSYQISNNDQYLVSMVLELNGSGPDSGSFVINFSGIAFDANTTAVSCVSDIPYANGHYCTGSIISSGPNNGNLKIAYETNVNAQIQIFIFGSQL